MEKLTVVIPFRNEGEEVAATVASLLEHSSAELFDVICLDDCSDDGFDYRESLACFGNVRYVCNPERLGVAGSRDRGVWLAETGQVLLLDGHMRFYGDVITPLIRHLERSPRTLFCMTTRVLKKEDGVVSVVKGRPGGRGARICLDMENQPKLWTVGWEQSRPEDLGKGEVPIPCVLGAAYAMNREYYLYLHGLNGLAQYGSDEALLSAKVWLEGGCCMLLQDLVAGHVYRKSSPCRISGAAMKYNLMMCARLLMPDDLWQTYHSWCTCQKWYPAVERVMIEAETGIRAEREYLRAIFTRNFDDLLMLNVKEYGNRIYPQ